MCLFVINAWFELFVCLLVFVCLVICFVCLFDLFVCCLLLINFCLTIFAGIQAV